MFVFGTKFGKNYRNKNVLNNNIIHIMKEIMYYVLIT